MGVNQTTPAQKVEVTDEKPVILRQIKDASALLDAHPRFAIRAFLPTGIFQIHAVLSAGRLILFNLSTLKPLKQIDLREISSVSYSPEFGLLYGFFESGGSQIYFEVDTKTFHVQQIIPCLEWEGGDNKTYELISWHHEKLLLYCSVESVNFYNITKNCSIWTRQKPNELIFSVKFYAKQEWIIIHYRSLNWNEIDVEAKEFLEIYDPHTNQLMSRVKVIGVRKSYLFHDLARERIIQFLENKTFLFSLSKNNPLEAQELEGPNHSLIGTPCFSLPGDHVWRSDNIIEILSNFELSITIDFSMGVKIYVRNIKYQEENPTRSARFFHTRRENFVIAISSARPRRVLLFTISN